MTIADSASGPTFDGHIDGQRSKGITNMQIFCFDMMLMEICQKQGRGPGFLVHHSHPFDGVDERKVAKALQLATERADASDLSVHRDDEFRCITQGWVSRRVQDSRSRVGYGSDRRDRNGRSILGYGSISAKAMSACDLLQNVLALLRYFFGKECTFKRISTIDFKPMHSLSFEPSR